MGSGAFSISLAVKDIRASKEFYEKLGFTAMMGEEEQNWLIMKNGDAVIGLFQGMFDRNIMTFNPGWDQDAKEVDPVRDIRVIQEELKERGIDLLSEVQPDTEGPGNFMLLDPDGNQILFDQHR
ncbi:VOC family protein [Youngiibacter fragilis]|uniref:Glyoxalase n=1 Tax=Youngiibacter fragilis 232.1 TaxID=994573 RepID=V7I3X6_9CLOT|nr:VOC family protein [Youngiibacter fragilis]ETA79894.1 glyoxalase [Youngiibacter fragilis 232.1]